MSQTSPDFADLEQTRSPSPDRQHERFTRQQLERYQARALQLCREYAYAHSPFYQQFHQGLMDRPLHELPILTKSLLNEHFDEIVTDRAVRSEDVKRYIADPNRKEFFLDRYRVMITSGSTGTPTIFTYNATEWGIVMASLGRVLAWLGPEAQGKPSMITATNPLYMTGHIQSTLAKRGPGGLRLAASDPLESIVQRLNEWQPTLLIGYPSIIRVLADEQYQGRLHIAPRAVVCGSEVLPDRIRRRAEEVWHIQPYNLYATTDGGLLGIDCDHHQGIHIFEDLVILEVVDHNNQPVPSGAFGDKVLLTVLFGRTMPLIRYELTDQIRLSPHNACSCGRPFTLIDDPRGRTADVLYFPSTTGVEVAIQPHVFVVMMDQLPISGWKIIQDYDGIHVMVSGARPEEVDETLLQSFRQTLAKYGAVIPPLHIEHVETFPRERSDKVTLIASRIARSTN